MQKIMRTPVERFFSLFSYILALSMCVFLLTGCESSKTIVNDLDEKDANEILVFLDSRGIMADKVKAESTGAGGGGGVKWNITVKASESATAMRLLNQQGLPRRATKTILESYSNSGLVPSDQQELIKYHALLGEQLANTIRKYDGVLDAEVQLSFPKVDPLNPEKSKGKITAAVWVKHSGVLDDPNSHMKSQIQRLVSSAVTGLSYDDVTVIGERSRVAEDYASGGLEAHEEKQYVKTWGVVISKESLQRFQLIFFTFSLLLLLLLLSLLWTLWRVWPILRDAGGLKSLLSTSKIEPQLLSDEAKDVSTEKGAKKETTKEDSKEGKANKNIDET